MTGNDNRVVTIILCDVLFVYEEVDLLIFIMSLSLSRGIDGHDTH